MTSAGPCRYDAEIDELHLPVLLLYPEPAQSDFIQDVAEGEKTPPFAEPARKPLPCPSSISRTRLASPSAGETMLPHLVEMFGERGENAPEWDRERRYRTADLRLYLSYKHEEDDRDVFKPIRWEREGGRPQPWPWPWA